MTGKMHPMKPDRAKIKPNMIITVVNCRFVVTIQVVRFGASTPQAKVHSSWVKLIMFLELVKWSSRQIPPCPPLQRGEPESSPFSKGGLRGILIRSGLPCKST
jgi:hypothetical protein